MTTRPALPRICGRQCQAKARRGRAIVNDIGSDAEPSPIYFCLQGRKRVRVGNGDRLLFRPINGCGRCGAGNVQIGRSGISQIGDRQLLRPTGGIRQQNPIVVGVDRCRDTDVLELMACKTFPMVLNVPLAQVDRSSCPSQVLVILELADAHASVAVVGT